MPYDKFLIAPLKSGLQNNVKPWLISSDAYSVLQNLYTWRGSVKKRAGGTLMNTSVGAPQDQLLSRFRVNIGTTAGDGSFTATVPGAIFDTGQAFSVGDEIFTVNALGTPANMLDSTNTAGLATFDTTTGQVDLLTIHALTDVFYYPATPVMGFGLYTTPSISKIFGFDQQFAYNFTYTTGWNRNPGGDTLNSTWTGDDKDFFWTTNYRGATANVILFFITNNVAADGFRYWDGTNFVQLGTSVTTPINTVPDYIVTAKIILPFKGRLLLFNVTENISASNVLFQNRVRYSQVGSPVSTDSWREDIIGKGGFIDAPIIDPIISAQFLKDRLIIFFENSTWELVYTGNELLPFVFQKINTELGAESLNSIIPFDQTVVGFGPNGINECNGINVQRIDELIPQEIFNVSNNTFGPQRVTGIRDYYNEVVYWAYNSGEETTGDNNIYPNLVLVYNYREGNWAFNQDSITALGNFYLQKTVTWADSHITWEKQQQLWSQTAEKDKFLSIIAGNQEGYTFIVDSGNSQNSKAMQITDMVINDATITVTARNHNLKKNSYVLIQDVKCFDGTLENVNDLIFAVDTSDPDTFSINTGTTVLTGTYSGGGVVTRVSELALTSKQYNFYNEVGVNTAVLKVDFLVDKTDFGQMAVNWDVSSSNRDFILDSVATQSLIGSSILPTFPNALMPLEETQSRFWHPVYFNAQGENFQFIMFFTPQQVMNKNIALSDFQLNAFIVHAMKTSQFGS
jgi:hypothetical protein